MYMLISNATLANRGRGVNRPAPERRNSTQCFKYTMNSSYLSLLFVRLSILLNNENDVRQSPEGGMKINCRILDAPNPLERDASVVNAEFLDLSV